MEGVLERIAVEQSEMRQDMREFRQETRSDTNALQTRMLQLWLGTMGTMMAGFIAIFVAIMLKG
jgi:hypothetical protein